MLAQATCIGNLGRDPEVKKLQSGKDIASFSIATENGYGDNKRTVWLNIVCFDEKLIQNVIQPYVKKGTKLFVQGNLNIREYDKDGETRKVTEIVLGFGSTLKLLSSAERSEAPQKAEMIDDDFPEL